MLYRNATSRCQTVEVQLRMAAVRHLRHLVPTAALVGMGALPPFAFAETLGGASMAKPTYGFRL